MCIVNVSLGTVVKMLPHWHKDLDCKTIGRFILKNRWLNNKTIETCICLCGFRASHKTNMKRFAPKKPSGRKKRHFALARQKNQDKADKSKRRMLQFNNIKQGSATASILGILFIVLC